MNVALNWTPRPRSRVEKNAAQAAAELAQLLRRRTILWRDRNPVARMLFSGCVSGHWLTLIGRPLRSVPVNNLI